MGSQVTASADISMTIPVIGQQDQAWGGAPLGTSPTDTVASSGCAVTAVTMMLAYYGINTDPGTLNAWLTANGGYFGDDDLLWAAVNQYTNNQVVFTGWYGSDVSLIKAELDVGHPVIAEVQLDGNQHFVLILGYTGNSFQINDPWFADTVNFADRYGDPASGIVSIRTFMPGDSPGPRDGGRVNWIATAIADLHPAQ
jgi:uncharacterized protein YvpB